MATRGGVFDPIEESVGSVIERLRALQEEFARAAAGAARLGATAREAADNVNSLASSASSAAGAVAKLGSSSVSAEEGMGENAISEAQSMTSQTNVRTGRIPIT